MSKRQLVGLLINSMQSETFAVQVPASVFAGRLSPLEAAVCYLRTAYGMKNCAVARILHKSPASTWQAYRRAGHCVPEAAADSPAVPASAFLPELSVLESVAVHLRKTHSTREAAGLLNKSEKTVAVLLWRAQNKLGKKLIN